MKKFSPSYFNIEQGRDYTIGIHGHNFDSRFLKCKLNEIYDLVVKFYNSTYIECTWSSYQDQRRYIIGISTNDG